MQSIQTLISAAHVIPIEPRSTHHEQYTIAIDNGRIVDLLPTEQALSKYTAEEHIDLANHVLLPGLINAHTHAPMNLLRGLGSDLPLMQWLQNHIWPAEQKWVSEAFVQDGTELAVAELLRSGVTCFNDMYFFPEVVAQTASSIGMRTSVGMIIIEFPSAYANSADEYFSKGLALFDRYKNDPLVQVCFAPHAPYTVSDDSLKKVGMYANELGIPVNMHVHETADEISQSIKEHGVRPLHRLNELGLVNDALLAVHMTQLTEEEITLVADAGVHVVHCPQSNLKLASGFCPVGKLEAAGVNIAIGTDGAASNDDLDMLAELNTAALLAKGVAEDATVLPAESALRAATINAANALGLSQSIGSLEIGKSADIIAIDLHRAETQPVNDLFGHLVYSTQREQVTDAWIAGKQLLKDRQFTTLSEEQLIEKAVHWSKKIQQ